MNQATIARAVKFERKMRGYNNPLKLRPHESITAEKAGNGYRITIKILDPKAEIWGNAGVLKI